MSHIAAALAKSKGKPVKTPPIGGVNDVPVAKIGPVESPFLHTIPTRKIAPAIFAKPQSPRRAPVRAIVICVSAVLVAALAFYLWTSFRKDNLFADLLPRPVPVKSAPPAQLSLEPGAMTKTESATVEALREKVRLLPITAVAGEASQRLSLGGKVYQPGETVAEGLILQSIEPDEIVFRDRAGNIYTRRR